VSTWGDGQEEAPRRVPSAPAIAPPQSPPVPLPLLVRVLAALREKP
jgi:hypothetical protein